MFQFAHQHVMITHSSMGIINTRFSLSLPIPVPFKKKFESNYLMPIMTWNTQYIISNCRRCEWDHSEQDHSEQPVLSVKCANHFSKRFLKDHGSNDDTLGHPVRQSCSYCSVCSVQCTWDHLQIFPSIRAMVQILSVIQLMLSSYYIRIVRTAPL